MTYEEKALIILESLDQTIQVDWNMQEYYIKAIVNGLKEIEKSDH